MPKSIFPASIRLANQEDVPRTAEWVEILAAVEKAEIVPGFVLRPGTERFSHYAEINVDGPLIWQVFCDLCDTLLDETATVLFGEKEGEPHRLGSSHVRRLIKLLEPYQYQLSQDGFLEFGLVSDENYLISEVYLGPTKHFKVWMNDEPGFRAVMARHALPEMRQISFLDEFPRTTTMLPADLISFRDPDEFAAHLEREILASPDDPPPPN